MPTYTFLDLELAITCNKKSNEAYLAAVSYQGLPLKITFKVCLLIVVDHSAPYIPHTTCSVLSNCVSDS